jgi:glutaredoxin
VKKFTVVAIDGATKSKEVDAIDWADAIEKAGDDIYHFSQCHYCAKDHALDENPFMIVYNEASEEVYSDDPKDYHVKQLAAKIKELEAELEALK